MRLSSLNFAQFSTASALAVLTAGQAVAPSLPSRIARSSRSGLRSGRPS